MVKRLFKNSFSIFILGLVVIGIIIALPAAAQVSLDFPSGSFAGAQNADLKQVIENIVRVVFGFIGIILVLLIIYAGWLWMTSQGDEGKIDQAKKIISAAVVGLLITIAAYAIASFIVGSLQGSVGPGGPGNGNGNGNGDGGSGSLGKVIESHYPGVNAKNIPRNTRIVVTFKEAMDVATFNTNNVIIENLNTVVADPLTAGDVTISNTPDKKTFTVSLNNGVLLGSTNGDTRYQVSLTNAIKKDSGATALPIGYTWRFTVSTSADTVAPTVTSVIPIGSGIDRNTLVQVNFSESMNPASASGDTAAGFGGITVTGSANGLAQGIYSIGNQYRSVEFRTNDTCGTNSCGGTVYCLAGGDSFTGKVTGGAVAQAVTDMAGNPLAADYTWNFSTSNNLDLTPPVISRQDPTHNSTGVNADYPITVEFNKEMSISSLNSDNIQLNGVGYWLESTTSGGKTVTTIHHYPFEAVTPYNVAISSSIKDSHQNCYSPCKCADPSGASCRCIDPDPGFPCNGDECTAKPTP